MPYVYYNETPSARIHDLLSTTCRFSMNWYPLSNKVVFHLSRLPLKSLSYRSHLLYDQLTYSNSKEYMSNSTKWITVVIDFMITCHLDHPRGYIVSISWDIIVPLLRIPIASIENTRCHHSSLIVIQSIGIYDRFKVLPIG